MKHISETIGTIQEWAARCAARAETPEFQANAAKLAEQTAAFNAAQREVDRKLALVQAGIPTALWDLLRAPKETPALVAVREWFAGPSACVFLSLAGQAGRGKTFAAAWAISERGGQYALAHDLVAAGTFDPIWKDLASAPLVALDELGNEYRNDAYSASLYTLLNTRHAHQRRTILATNLDAPAFAARYCPEATDPLRDRLRTASRWVNLSGESMRKHWTEATDREPGEEG